MKKPRILFVVLLVGILAFAATAMADVGCDFHVAAIGYNTTDGVVFWGSVYNPSSQVWEDSVGPVKFHSSVNDLGANKIFTLLLTAKKTRKLISMTLKDINYCYKSVIGSNGKIIAVNLWNTSY